MSTFAFNKDPAPEDCLVSGKYIDHDSPEITCFVQETLSQFPASINDTQKAIALFNAVRDKWLYNPFAFDLSEDGFTASKIVARTDAYCVPKAILLTACLRAACIPAAVGFADVRNHLSTPKLRETMGTDLFVYHGYVKLWLNGISYKITPAFNMEMCTKFGVKPLVFDGRSDALFHEFNANDDQHMEYVKDHGAFSGVPRQQIISTYIKTYPNIAAPNPE